MQIQQRLGIISCRPTRFRLLIEDSRESYTKPETKREKKFNRNCNFQSNQRFRVYKEQLFWEAAEKVMEQKIGAKINEITEWTVMWERIFISLMHLHGLNPFSFSHFPSRLWLLILFFIFSLAGSAENPRGEHKNSLPCSNKHDEMLFARIFFLALFVESFEEDFS